MTEDAVSDKSASEWLRGMACGVGDESRCRKRRNAKGDWDLARDALRERSRSAGACEADLTRFIESIERPRSLSSALSLVLVRDSESDESPPIMDENDMPKAPFFGEAASGDLTG